MDLNTIAAVERPLNRGEVPRFADGDAWLAGGTWLFSEPQGSLRRLVDLAGLDWPALEITEAGLSIAATCTIATLDALEVLRSWNAAPLIGRCCEAFLASAKVQSVATVGGNLCMALPAGPMISLCAALDGRCTVWTPEGGERVVPVVDFILGPQKTVLAPGELLRRIDLPREALARRAAFRRLSLTPLGRSGVLLIGTVTGDGRFEVTVTAATRKPVQLRFEKQPSATDLAARLDEAINPDLYFDDVHGRPAWRRDVTYAFAEEIRAELAAGQR